MLKQKEIMKIRNSKKKHHQKDLLSVFKAYKRQAPPMSSKKYHSTYGEEQISKIAKSTYSAEISQLKEAQIKNFNVSKILTILLVKDNKEI